MQHFLVGSAALPCSYMRTRCPRAHSRCDRHTQRSSRRRTGRRDPRRRRFCFFGLVLSNTRRGWANVPCWGERQRRWLAALLPLP
jgi:hypothetical protein